MGIKAIANGNKIEIQISGRFEFSLHREFRDGYRHSDGPATEYEINLAGVDYLDSSALGMLLLLREHAGGERARIALTHCGPEVMRILKIANFQRMFSIAQS